jgi:hypothetical protein
VTYDFGTPGTTLVSFEDNPGRRRPGLQRLRLHLPECHGRSGTGNQRPDAGRTDGCRLAVAPAQEHAVLETLVRAARAAPLALRASCGARASMA